MKEVECNRKVTQFITMISCKLNKKDSVFVIPDNDSNYTFALKFSKYDIVKVTSTYLSCVTCTIEYSNINHGNITGRKSLQKVHVHLESLAMLQIMHLHGIDCYMISK